MATVVQRAAEIKKSLTAVVGFVAQIVATGLLHGTAETVAQVILAVATVFGVYVAKNADKDEVRA